MPQDTFFDLGPVHILTTSTINQLRELYPEGRFEARRFRPNIVVETPGETGFVENTWLNHTAAIGHEVVLRVFSPFPRCVMTTLPQDDLPQDYGILRTAAQHNNANVGVYAMVVQPGLVRRGTCGWWSRLNSPTNSSTVIPASLMMSRSVPGATSPHFIGTITIIGNRASARRHDCHAASSRPSQRVPVL